MKENSLEITKYIQIAKKKYKEGNLFQANEIYKKLLMKRVIHMIYLFHMDYFVKRLII